MSFCRPTQFLASISAWACLSLAASAQVPTPGSPDFSFSGDGIATASLAGNVLRTNAMDVQPDGGVILAGSAWSGGSNYKMVVTRLTAAGALDTGFGTAGFTTYGPAQLPYAARAVKVLSSGRMLVAGDSGSGVQVFRLLADGTLDSTFSITSINVGSNCTAAGMAIQSDGRVIVSGQVTRPAGSDYDAFLYRVNANGGQDTTFGTSGRYVLSTSTDHTVKTVAVQSDNKILFGGSLNSGSGYVARLTANGAVDNSFVSSVGLYSFDLNSQAAESTTALALDASQNILVLSSITGGSHDVAITRLASTGQRDTLFSEDGYQTSRLGTASMPTAILVQPDGRILISGHSSTGPDSAKFLLGRFQWNGNPDSSIGTAGIFGLALPNGDVESAAVAFRDGKILVAGSSPADTGFIRNATAIRLHAGPDLPLTDINIITQPQPVTVSIGQQVALSVEATSAEALVYSWYFNNTLVRRSNEPFYNFVLNGTWLEGSYRVELRAGNTVKNSNTVLVRMLQPPVIPPLTPVWINYLNGYGGLYTQVEGRRPITCRWFKDDLEISSQVLTYSWESAQHIFSPVTADSNGHYRLEATNSDGSAVSNTILHRAVTDPSVYVPENPGVVIELGSGFSLSPQINSTLEARTQWFKDGKALTGALEYVYTKEAVTLADAGNYTVSVRSVRGKSLSDPIPVGVVDTRARTHVFAEGKKHQISLPFAGPGLHFEWYQNDVKLEPRTGLSGLDTATLTFSNVQAGDSGAYTCKITAGEMELVSGIQEVVLASAPPELGSVTLPDGRVSIRYAVQLDLPEFASHFDIKGLPAGFVYSKVDHTITGHPMKAARYPITIAAVNPLGSSAKVKATLTIHPLPATRQGRFYHRLSDGYSEGDIDITITSTGAYSGKLSLCDMSGKAGTATFKGVFDTSPAPDNGGGEDLGTFTSSTTFGFTAFGPLRGKPSLNLRLSDGYLEVDLLLPRTHPDGDYDMFLQAMMPHIPWGAKQPLGIAYRGVFNLGFPGIYNGPRGWSYGRATISSAGTLALVATLSDGTAVTASTPVNAGYEAVAPRFLYGNRGIFAFNFTVNPGTGGPDYLDASVSGTASWRKNTEMLAGQKNYPLAFAGDMSVTGGAKYLPPNYDSLTGPLMLNASVGGRNVTAMLFDNSTSGLLQGNHVVRFTESEAENPWGIKGLTFNATTGSFSGSGTLVYSEERYNPRTEETYYVTLREPYKFHGLVIREPTALRSTGVGYCLRPIPYDNGEGKVVRLMTSFPFEIGPN